MLYHARQIKLFSMSSRLGSDASKVLINMMNFSLQLKSPPPPTPPFFFAWLFFHRTFFLLTGRPGSNIWHPPHSLLGLQFRPEIFGLSTTSMKTSMRKNKTKQKRIFPSTNTEASLNQSGSFWENSWYSCCCRCRVVRRLKDKIQNFDTMLRTTLQRGNNRARDGWPLMSDGNLALKLQTLKAELRFLLFFLFFQTWQWKGS